jgi:small subunit ribosomal protein S3
MGQKVHPTIVRLGLTATHRALWYARPKDYSKKVKIDLLARAYLEKALKSAGISAIFVAFTTKESTIIGNGLAQKLANITAHVARPGMVIGKRGGLVERIKKDLEGIMEMPVYLSIQEIRKPELDAKLIAENIAHQIVRRINHRRAIKKAEDMAMNTGALGVKVIVSGRLGGTEIARRETYQKGSVPLHTFSKPIDYAQATAQTSSGKVGVIVYVHTKPVVKREFVERTDALESDARRVRTDRDRPSKDHAKRYPHKETPSS